MRTGIKIFGLLMIVIIALTGFLAVYPYANSYMPVETHDKREKLPVKGDPILYSSSGNWEDDYRRMIAQNFILLGTSDYATGLIGSNAALALAQMIGAQVVLIDQKYADETTKFIPFSARIKTSKNASNTVVSSSGAIESDTPAGLAMEDETTFIPPIVENPDYSAQFWARAKVPVFGANFLNYLPSDAQNEGVSIGVKIYLIIRNSPAHHGDVRVNDLITHIDGDPVKNVKNFMETIADNAGKEILLTVTREQQIMTLPIKLNDLQ